MSEPTSATTSSGATIPAPAGRVIVELTAEGKLMIEFYTNGQRTRTTLDRGNEWWQIVNELHVQRDAQHSAAERQALRDSERSRKRHREVWINTAESHGAGFAKNVIGGDVPMGYGQYFEKPKAPKAPKAPAAPGPTVDELSALL